MTASTKPRWSPSEAWSAHAGRVPGLWAWPGLEAAEAIVQAHGVGLEDVLGPSRVRRVSAARHDAWRVLRHDFGWKLVEIGLLFGRNHTTVLAALRVSSEARN